MIDDRIQTVLDFKDTIATIEGAKEEILSILAKVSYKNTFTSHDIAEVLRIEKILKRIRV